MKLETNILGQEKKKINLQNDILKVKKWNWWEKNGEKGWYIQASSAFLDAKLTSNRPSCCWRTSSTTEAREKVKTGSVAITWPQETQKKKKKRPSWWQTGKWIEILYINQNKIIQNSYEKAWALGRMIEFLAMNEKSLAEFSKEEKNEWIYRHCESEKRFKMKQKNNITRECEWIEENKEKENVFGIFDSFSRFLLVLWSFSL